LFLERVRRIGRARGLAKPWKRVRAEEILSNRKAKGSRGWEDLRREWIKLSRM
jgi:hypothetical protein